jgi:hypothetical protein
MKTLPPTPATVADWRARAIAVAPLAPLWLHAAVGAMLADPRASSDAMLALADALEEAARTANLYGRPTAIARELRLLADLPRQQAPSRASHLGDVP